MKYLMRWMTVVCVLAGGSMLVSQSAVEAVTCPTPEQCIGFDVGCSQDCFWERAECGDTASPTFCDALWSECLRHCCLRGCRP